jgi:GT2 family glycosyltransferase
VILTTTVIIVTLNRPDCVRKCLDCLDAQQPPAEQLIVVDASRDDRTRDVVQSFPHVIYLRNDNGFGRMTASRNIGLKASTGDIIAFLDDDAFAHEGWLKNLLAAYDDPTVDVVGGRALNNQPGEALDGVDRIGRLTKNGSLEGWFAADPGRIIEVDHVMGCNMSFRRNVLAELGGFREDYPGISGVCEDSDMCVRVRRSGYKIAFCPSATVTHIGAPQAKGKRFDTRYAYFASRNHMALLVRNFGGMSGIVGRYSVYIFAESVRDCVKRIGGAVIRFAAAIGGTLIGFISGLWLLTKVGRDPVRRDVEGGRIRAHLERRETVPEREMAKS